jgi:hypothetical protein
VVRNNKRDEIVGVFIWEKVWLENSPRGFGEGACPSRETGCGGQGPQMGARVSMRVIVSEENIHSLWQYIIASYIRIYIYIHTHTHT